MSMHVLYISMNFHVFLHMLTHFHTPSWGGSSAPPPLFGKLSSGKMQTMALILDVSSKYVAYTCRVDQVIWSVLGIFLNRQKRQYFVNKLLYAYNRAQRVLIYLLI